MNKSDAIQQLAIALGQPTNRDAYNAEGWSKKQFKFRPDEKTASAGFNIESGNVKDFGGGGNVTSLKDLLKLHNIDYPNDRTPVADSMIVFTDIRHYATAHGGLEVWFEKAGWEETVHYMRPCFSYGVATGTRFRFIDGKKPKIISREGTKNCFYGLEKAIAIVEDGMPLIMVNGESSVIVGQGHELPVFCKTGGEATLANELLFDTKGKPLYDSMGMFDYLTSRWQNEIIIALDCDKTGRDASKKLVEQLPNARAIDLGLGNKGDLADYCYDHTHNSKRDLIALIGESKEDKQSPATAPVILPDHTKDTYTADKILDDLNLIFAGKSPVRERSYPHPITSLHKFGGYMRYCKTGKTDIYMGGSGAGKTQLMETMNDNNNNNGVHTHVWSLEWSAKELMMRRINRWSQPHITMDMMELHLMWLGYKQDGVADKDNKGSRLTDAQLATVKQVSEKIKLWTGKTECFGGEPTLEDTFLAMADGIERSKSKGLQVLNVCFDYAQLLNAKGWDGSSNRIEFAAEEVQRFASRYNVHVNMPTQINKDASRSAEQDGRSISAMDAHFLRPDKFNGAFGIDRVYYENKPDEWMPSPYYWLTNRKASLSGSLDEERYARVPMTMHPLRLLFDFATTGIDSKTKQPRNWTLNPELAHLKGYKGK